MQEPEAQKQVSDYPDNSKPAGDSKNNGDLFATHGDLSPEPEESGTPLSPNTGEEKDLSGRTHAPLQAVNHKPILPSEEEIAGNTRARSAKLRIAERV